MCIMRISSASMNPNYDKATHDKVECGQLHSKEEKENIITSYKEYLKSVKEFYVKHGQLSDLTDHVYAIAYVFKCTKKQFRKFDLFWNASEKIAEDVLFGFDFKLSPLMKDRNIVINGSNIKEARVTVHMYDNSNVLLMCRVAFISPFMDVSLLIDQCESVTDKHAILWVLDRNNELSQPTKVETKMIPSISDADKDYKEKLWQVYVLSCERQILRKLGYSEKVISLYPIYSDAILMGKNSIIPVNETTFSDILNRTEKALTIESEEDNEVMAFRWISRNDSIKDYDDVLEKYGILLANAYFMLNQGKGTQRQMYYLYTRPLSMLNLNAIKRMTMETTLTGIKRRHAEEWNDTDMFTNREDLSISEFLSNACSMLHDDQSLILDYGSRFMSQCANVFIVFIAGLTLITSLVNLPTILGWLKEYFCVIWKHIEEFLKYYMAMKG